MASFQSGRISPDSQNLWEMIHVLPRHFLAPSELCDESHQVPWICELSANTAGTFHFQCQQMRSVFFLFLFFFLKTDIQTIVLPQKALLNSSHSSIIISRSQTPKAQSFCFFLFYTIPANSTILVPYGQIRKSPVTFYQDIHRHKKQ